LSETFSYNLISCLNSLIGVAHHGNEQVDEDDHCNHEVDREDDLEHLDGPLADVVGQLEVLGAGEAKQGEKEKVEHLDGRRVIS
jgi:hypothetical protein